MSEKAEKVMQQPVSESMDNLLKSFHKLEEKGQTALGPALLTSLAIANKVLYYYILNNQKKKKI